MNPVDTRRDRYTASFERLAVELEGRMTGTEPWSDELFGTLASRAFRLQFEAIGPFRAFCEARGKTPDTVGAWSEIPAVPARAFKHLDLSVAEPELVFRTSGTTHGPGRRGRHLVPRSSLYRAALAEPFRRHVLGGRVPMPFLSLIPSPQELPDSSLSFMVGTAAEQFASETRWLVDGSGALNADIEDLLDATERGGEPVAVLGTALALLHLLERLERDGRAVELPNGSRVMETGGFKGSRRDVPKSELYAGIARGLGVPAHRIVNEYGMTELLSQLYTATPADQPAGDPDASMHVPPPWLRIRALHPESLEALPDGQDGLLAFFDLANAGSVCHVLTEDVGRTEGGRVRLLGRVAGAEPRGCSRAMDELMSASRSSP